MRKKAEIVNREKFELLKSSLDWYVISETTWRSGLTKYDFKYRNDKIMKTVYVK